MSIRAVPTTADVVTPLSHQLPAWVGPDICVEDSAPSERACVSPSLQGASNCRGAPSTAHLWECLCPSQTASHPTCRISGIAPPHPPSGAFVICLPAPFYALESILCSASSHSRSKTPGCTTARVMRCAAPSGRPLAACAARRRCRSNGHSRGVHLGG